jgi:TorA maturation chaperone TorD/NAD-dependent dihydropyrimidine dehydrogenase PreA subunit
MPLKAKMGTPRSELYGALAEVLSDPPEWLALSGSEWPLFSIANDLAMNSPSARKALERMKIISPEPIGVRQERYNALFSGTGRPRFWLHESLYRSGKLFGSETREVEGIYRTAGLVMEGAELPDHASIELAFLAYVANQQDGTNLHNQVWAEVERTFISAHAGRWLPALGRDLAESGDEVYAPIGQLLAEGLSGSRQRLKNGISLLTGLWVPVLQEKENCSLCGFCVQVCPRRVLQIHENSTETILVRSRKSCSGCGKCVGICQVQALKLGQINTGAGVAGEMVVLHSSPRAHCPRCGQPTVSQAEIEYIQEQIGNLPWIELCQDCRFSSMEEVQ